MEGRKEGGGKEDVGRRVGTQRGRRKGWREAERGNRDRRGRVKETKREKLKDGK